ncbi:cytochrome d ubiquinol oxidase subunit II [Corynebacterium breve]|uniref:Cytochrome d ubiquinol oxidase subunit II n=1 Tax=Corynebacterium breve TaxID=3049799 RepID=A0ABY8VGF6_9CORY|nr:cytochrome d ubiquinol oxidase subunit II [Corynebacterium breve]WIM67294.1 cytochrome d ubiquinol oxidase subunit II [Corynebacterium breve]
MDLNILWFFVIAFFFVGYFILEGFDFGVGMLLPFVGGENAEANDRRRTASIKTIGPIWDGNEVWLITGGAAIFAAFPEWYATLFSGFYLPLVLILIALIVRGVSIEWRVKVDTVAWRKKLDIGTVFGSYLPAILWGVAFTNIVAGVPMNEDGRINSFTDGFIGLLNPLGLLGGFAFMLVFMLHGALFLGFKSEDPLRSHMHAFAKKWLVVPTVLVGAVYLIWVQLTLGAGWTWVVLALTVVFLLAAIVALFKEHDGWAFALTAFTILGVGLLLFGSLFPDVMPSTSTAFAGWDIYNASSSPYTLKVMTWAAVIFLPAVLITQGWTYWSFRKRVKV